MNRPRAHSADELGLAAATIGYEVHMCAGQFARLARHDGDLFTSNALLEAALLHLRSMTVFLLESGEKDDVRRWQFTPERRWSPAPSNDAALLREARPAIDKHLAHLTWERATNTESAEWNYLRLGSAVVRLTDNWTDHIAGYAAQPVAEACQRNLRPYVLWAAHELGIADDVRRSSTVRFPAPGR